MSVETREKHLEHLFEQVFDGYQTLEDPELHAQRRREFVSHMMDCLENLDALAEVYARPNEFTEDSAGSLIRQFLHQAVPHLHEANRLLTPSEASRLSCREVMGRIRTQQQERGHRPPTREEVDESLQVERKSWN